MIVWILIVAGGLIISLAGIVLTFISKPPTLELAKARQPAAERGREILEEAIARSLMTPEKIKAAGEEAARKEEQKIKFSIAGVRLLLLGAVAQIIGTVGQVVVLASRR